ncbi:hypothetical protein QE385_000499 [Sphingomonas sp. SORGH_AS 950]|uniref:hypothetical protein n=1 Tax=Sphingomonas sp. SORGH_AS_0950 TaxID=3041792 RepID=UPI0027819925|nr:hypothetical protein [Sphingomonas sp. SORGH_AS_0950]MDQ1156172.1 hypothetical protein [Sphingomonas sp. SORGH_AS_0950]
MMALALMMRLMSRVSINRQIGARSEDGPDAALLRAEDGHYRRLFERQAGTTNPEIVA